MCVWEPGTGATINTIHGHVDTVKSVAFNPKTDNVALPVLASAGDFTLRLSDPRPSQKADILALSPHTSGKEVEAVAATPDGSLVISGGRDGILVIMTLFVPSVMPRSESLQSTSAILRRSRVIRERSYLYDTTREGEGLEELEEEDDLQAEQEAEDLDLILAGGRRTQVEPTTFSRMKRRSRFAEKDAELPDHATVRRKGINAKASRARRTRGKAVDIPTMVAHLSAAIRAYGPEEPSSSESEDDGQSQDMQAAPVNVFSKVIALERPPTLSTPKASRPSIDNLHHLREHSELFEQEERREGAREGGEEVEKEYLTGFDLLSDTSSTGQPSRELDRGRSTALESEKGSGEYTLGAPDYYDTSLRMEDFGLQRMAGGIEDIIHMATPDPMLGSRKLTGYRANLFTAEEGEEVEEEVDVRERERRVFEEMNSGEEDNILSMI